MLYSTSCQLTDSDVAHCTVPLWQLAFLLFWPLFSRVMPASIGIPKENLWGYLQQAFTNCHLTSHINAPEVKKNHWLASSLHDPLSDLWCIGCCMLHHLWWLSVSGASTVSVSKFVLLVYYFNIITFYYKNNFWTVWWREKSRLVLWGFVLIQPVLRGSFRFRLLSVWQYTVDMFMLNAFCENSSNLVLASHLSSLDAAVWIVCR